MTSSQSRAQGAGSAGPVPRHGGPVCNLLLYYVGPDAGAKPAAGRSLGLNANTFVGKTSEEAFQPLAGTGLYLAAPGAELTSGGPMP